MQRLMSSVAQMKLFYLLVLAYSERSARRTCYPYQKSPGISPSYPSLLSSFSDPTLKYQIPGNEVDKKCICSTLTNESSVSKLMNKSFVPRENHISNTKQRLDTIETTRSIVEHITARGRNPVHKSSFIVLPYFHPSIHHNIHPTPFHSIQFQCTFHAVQ